jgi:nucleoside-diphosphate-sugar epimerase
MKLLLTGASGFLGRNFLLRAPEDWRILAVYRQDAGFPRFLRAHGRHAVTPVACDLDDPASVARLFAEHGSRWDACLYLAAKVDVPWSVRDPAGDLRANVVPLLNVLDAVRVGRLVYFSSGAVYDGAEGEVDSRTPVSPTLPYAISKLAAERYVESYCLRKQTITEYLIVRFFGAYGPYEAAHKIYTRLIQAFVRDGRSEYTIYGDGSNLIDAMYVDDAVTALLRILESPHANDIVDLAGGRPLAVDVLVREVADALGVTNVQIRKEGIANEKNRFWGSTEKMRDLFGFVPEVSLASGIRRFSEFLGGRTAASAGAMD